MQSFRDPSFIMWCDRWWWTLCFILLLSLLRNKYAREREIYNISEQQTRIFLWMRWMMGKLWMENCATEPIMSRKEMRWKKLKKIKIFNFFSRSLECVNFFSFLFIYRSIRRINLTLIVLLLLYLHFLKCICEKLDYNEWLFFSSSSGLNRTRISFDLSLF